MNSKETDIYTDPSVKHLGHPEDAPHNPSKENLEFLATISHEIRTPLNAIIGISDLLRESPTPEEQQEYLDILHTSSRNLLELVNNVLDFSKVKSGKLKVIRRPIRLRRIIHNSLYGQKTNARANDLDLIIEVDERIPHRVWGDSVKLSQVLVNLISNAIKFTDEGSVTLSAELMEENGPDLKIKYSVKDTGIGIPKEQLKNIFRAFDQGEEDINIKYAGTGLGLSISSKLVKLMGGRIDVESRLGKGTKFSFELSMEMAKMTRSSKERKEEKEKKFAGGLRILLAEDNRVNLLIAAKHLKSWNAKYETAANGLEVLEKLEEEDFDLILLDLQMPEMDGFETARRIRSFTHKKYQNLPLIALSAHSKEAYLKELKEAGIDDLITKPFDPANLFDKLNAFAKKKATRGSDSETVKEL